MLKAKNIIIIFVVNYLLILLVCSVLELVMISNNAQQVQLLMRTAGDMALEQIQATDDYFTSGGGYIIETDMPGMSSSLDSYERNRAYQLMANTGSTFEQVDLFPAITGETETSRIYKKLYGDMDEFIDENPKVLSLRMAAGIVEDKSINGLIESETGDIEYEISNFVMKWYSVPKLCMMGDEVIPVEHHQVYDGISAVGTIPADTTAKGLLWDMYDFKTTAKKTKVNGRQITYYLTPISLGVTYINEEFLQTLFINNLDLLMRAKYMSRGSYDLQSEECGNGMLKGAFYPELVDTDSLKSYNPINNGSFTLLRGSEKADTRDAMLYNGTVQPKIEYVVIDAYDNTSATNNILRQIYGPRFTDKSPTAGAGGLDAKYIGKPISGRLFKEIESESNALMKETAGVSRGAAGTIFDHKPIVVAKVTFYADFIIPYSTVSLREMRGREDNNKIGGRHLFNAFSFSPANLNGTSHLPHNYVDLEIKNLRVSEGSSGWDLIYTDDYYDDYFVRQNELNSDAMTYTTFFAITP